MFKLYFTLTSKIAREYSHVTPKKSPTRIPVISRSKAGSQFSRYPRTPFIHSFVCAPSSRRSIIFSVDLIFATRSAKLAFHLRELQFAVATFAFSVLSFHRSSLFSCCSDFFRRAGHSRVRFHHFPIFFPDRIGFITFPLRPFRPFTPATTAGGASLDFVPREMKLRRGPK